MAHLRPLAIDMFVGIGGWSSGLVAAGWDVIGFDIVDMFSLLGEPRPDHFSLVIQDVLTIHGSQFKDVGLICSSSPCQEYSWMAMPWTRAKAKATAIRADETGEALRKLNELFHAQFRIQREASEAAGRHIPMVVENVRGAIPWVGRSRANFGSYHLWGDVPALLPMTTARKVSGFRFDGSGGSFQTAAVNETGVKVSGMSWSGSDKPGYKAVALNDPRHHRAQRHEDAAVVEGRKAPGWMGGVYQPHQHGRNTGSGSKARKAASAKIAKIPRTLSEFIGRVWLP